MGLNPWTGKGRNVINSIMPSTSTGDPGSPTGYGLSNSDLTEYTYNTFSGSKDYVNYVSCDPATMPNDFIGYSLKGRQLISPDESSVGGAYQWEKARTFSRLSSKILISPNMATFSNDLYAVTGHEVIHAFHAYSGAMADIGGGGSDYYGYTFSASINHSIPSPSYASVIDYYRTTFNALSTKPLFPSWLNWESTYKNAARLMYPIKFPVMTR